MQISKRGITLLSQLGIDADLAMGAHGIILDAGQTVDGKDVSTLISALSELEIDVDLAMGAHNITLGAGQTVDGRDIGAMEWGLAIFGDGSDGDVIISTNTNLARDMFYNSLTINPGITLSNNGFRVFVKETLTNNGTIKATGNSSGTLKPGSAGGSGGSNGASNPGDDGGALSYAIGGRGGNGGYSYHGDGGTITPPGVSDGGHKSAFFSVVGALISPVGTNFLSPGTGGGGGGGAGGSAGNYPKGGSGGTGGHMLIIIAKRIDNSGNINANGNAGGNGSLSGHECNGYQAGGGGGGGGGAIVLIYNELMEGTLEVNEGAGGLAVCEGLDGDAGASGNIIKIPNA